MIAVMTKRIGVVSFMHESNSFNPSLTTRSCFEATSLLFGSEILTQWGESEHEIGGMLTAIRQQKFEIVPLAVAWAMPGGPVQGRDFREILTEICSRCSSAGVDGLLLSLHGAMLAEGHADADAVICERIRESVGWKSPIVLTLDLHANVSPKMISQVDATVIYRTYPHLDQRERGVEAAQLLVRILNGKIRPVQRLEKPPMVISILAQWSDREPMRTLLKRLDESIRKPGILSGSIACGFAYADVEKMGPAFLSVTDDDPALAEREAQELARMAWEVRRDLHLSGLSIEKAIRRTATATTTPMTLNDVGDNVGGGAPGDGTLLFEELRRRGIHDTLVVLHDPTAVQRCVDAGVSAEVSLLVGGKSPCSAGNPVPIRGRLRMLHDGVFVERLPRHGGVRRNNQGITAVVETVEGDTVVLTSLRMAPFSLEQILSLGIHPEFKRVLIVKGAIAPRAAYEPVSAEILEVDSPGITSANPFRFEFLNRRRPLYPFEQDAIYAPQETLERPAG